MLRGGNFRWGLRWSSGTGGGPGSVYSMCIKDMLKEGHIRKDREEKWAECLKEGMPLEVGTLVKKFEIQQKNARTNQDMKLRYKTMYARPMVVFMESLEEKKVYKPTHMDYIALIPYYLSFADCMNAFVSVCRRIKGDSIDLNPIQENLISEAGLQALKGAQKTSATTDEVLSVLDKLVLFKVTPTVFHWTLALRVQKILGGEPELMDKLWEQMVSSGIRPNRFTYIQYISACRRRCFRYDKVKDKHLLLEEITRAERMFNKGILDKVDDLSVAASLIMRMISENSTKQEADRFMHKILQTPSVSDNLGVIHHHVKNGP